MEIVTNSQYKCKNTTTTYTYKWGFGENTFGQVLDFHSAANCPFVSEEVRFDNGILGSRPHQIKIFISKEGTLYVGVCIEPYATIMVDQEQKACKITDVQIFNFVHCGKGPLKVYDFELLTDIHSPVHEINSWLFPLNQQANFNQNAWAYLYRARTLCNSLKNRSTVSRICPDLYSWNKTAMAMKDKVTHLSFEFQITSLSWNTHSHDDWVVHSSSSVDQPEDLKSNPIINPGLLEIKPFYKSTDFSDFIIQCGTKTFPVHKIVLAGKSSVFERMFQQPLKEMETGRLVIEDSESDVVEEFLRFLYTGEIEARKMNDCCTGLLLMADKYAVDDLKLICENAVVKEVNENNLMDLYNYGTMINSPALVNRCVQVLKRKRNEVLKTTEDVERFSKKCPGLMLKLVQENK